MNLLRVPQRRVAPGSIPGTVLADPCAARPEIQVMAYDLEALDEFDLLEAKQASAHVGQKRTVWINVTGLGDANTIRELGEAFGIHGLALEDVVNTYQRPKIEEYRNHLFVVLRMLDTTDGSQSEQISFFLGDGHLLTFQENPDDCFESIRKRIRDKHGRIRHNGPDYLAYCLMDAIIDDFFPQVDVLGERLEELEEEVLRSPSVETLNEIHRTRHALLAMRRNISSTREVMNALLRDTGGKIEENTRVYLRDCYDHAIQLLDIIESQREIAAGLLDVYLSSVNNRMNEVMKVLTVIATLFIPLTFLVGVYGMNFDTQVSPYNMPELENPYGYPVLLAIMAVVIVAELGYFYYRGWIGRR
ncbi:MAG: magnesium/cobalt transporter CorA [Candidatus Hydrogenedentes bacterium]|nr:magnesium/cobalt transporter CorA [Candidatus Hydrogenedentota bacterium]